MLWIGPSAGQPTHTGTLAHTPDLTETGPIEYRQGYHLLYPATLNHRVMREGEGQKGAR